MYMSTNNEVLDIDIDCTGRHTVSQAYSTGTQARSV